MAWDRNVDRARAGPQLERQVPPPGGAVDARLPHADAGQPAVGLRRARRSSGAGSSPRARASSRRTSCSARSPIRRGYLFECQPGRALALGRGHHLRSDHQCAPAAAVHLAQPQRGLLQRRHAGLARGRPDHPRGHRRRARARRFRAGVLRRNDGDSGSADLRLRRRGRDAERGPSLRLGGLPRHALPDARPARRRSPGSSRPATAWCGRTSPIPTTRAGWRATQATSTCSIRSASTLDKDGKVTATLWDSPAFDAGMVDGAQIVAVDGEAYSADAHQATRSPRRRTAASRSSCWSSAASAT